jgi:protein gp37
MYRDSFDGTRYNPLQVVRTKTVFNLPLKIKEPSKIFTCSLTDFFHPAIDSYRSEAWDIIGKCPQHTFQILTKRPERIADNLPQKYLDNVWVGTSVGHQGAITMVDELIKVPVSIKFLSIEPLWGPVDIEKYISPCSIFCDHGIEYKNEGHRPTTPKVQWVIIGGESGNETGKYRYRPCKLEWIENIVNLCRDNGVPVFVKQMGTHLAKELGMSDRHGTNIEEFPKHLQIRQFPIISPNGF